jgi:hypothetical protein
MKVLAILIGFLLATLHANEDVAQGYKVVLMSYGTFDEAKGALASVVLSKKDEDFQKKYNFEIVARPSGKSYILAIEPLSGQSIADKVIEHFKPLYKNAYSSQYFGATKGTLFLNKKAPEEKVVEKKVDEEKTAQSPVLPQPIAPQKSTIPWIWIMLFGVPIAGALFGLMMGKIKRASR